MAENVALRKPAKQSGIAQGFLNASPENGVDGDPSAESCVAVNRNNYATDPNGPGWWQIDLGKQHDIYKITVFPQGEDERNLSKVILISLIWLCGY